MVFAVLRLLDAVVSDTTHSTFSFFFVGILQYPAVFNCIAKRPGGSQCGGSRTMACIRFHFDDNAKQKFHARHKTVTCDQNKVSRNIEIQQKLTIPANNIALQRARAPIFVFRDLNLTLTTKLVKTKPTALHRFVSMLQWKCTDFLKCSEKMGRP